MNYLLFILPLIYAITNRVRGSLGFGGVVGGIVTGLGLDDEAGEEGVEELDLVVADGGLEVGAADAGVVGEEDVGAAGEDVGHAEEELGALVDAAGGDGDDADALEGGGLEADLHRADGVGVVVGRQVCSNTDAGDRQTGA